MWNINPLLSLDLLFFLQVCCCTSSPCFVFAVSVSAPVNPRLYNLQEEIRGACSGWPWCRGSGRFMWVVYWTVSSRTGICSTSQPLMASMWLALQWKLQSWMPMTTVPSATRSGMRKYGNGGETTSRAARSSSAAEQTLVLVHIQSRCFNTCLQLALA